nr:ATP synthase F0 subunit 6 [Yoda sp. d ASH-2021]
MINLSLFDQFNPPIWFIPMITLTLIITPAWITLLQTPNWLNTRSLFTWQSLITELPAILLRAAGNNSAQWAALIFSLFIILISTNLLGLIPHSFTPTSHLSITLSIALPLWLSVTILGFRNNFSQRLSHLLPQGTPSLLIPLLVWIEVLSLFAQPLALALRLAANLTAGHLLIYLLAAASWALTPIMPLVGSLTAIILVLLFILEIAVACIQAYVFVALASFYLQQNL